MRLDSITTHSAFRSSEENFSVASASVLKNRELIVVRLFLRRWTACSAVVALHFVLIQACFSGGGAFVPKFLGHERISKDGYVV